MTPPDRTLLAGLDFFDSSKAALAEAKRLVRSGGGSLIVTHVIDERLWHQLADDFQLMHDDVIVKAKNQVAREIGDDGSDITTSVVVGHPVEAILEVCEEHGVGMLILGAQGSHEDAKGRGGGLGNVASRLLRHAPCDVLLVRKSQDHPFRRILAGVDFSETSSRVVERAITIAEQDKAELTVLHVLPHLEDPPSIRSPLEALGVYAIELQGRSQSKLKRKAAESLDALVEEHEHLIQRATVHTAVVTHDDPRTCLLHEAARRDAELLVLGKLGHSEIREIMLGSTAERIAHLASVSVLAVT